jgi:hypothetical protein
MIRRVLVIRPSDPESLPLLDENLRYRGVGRVPTGDEVARQSGERVPWVDFDGYARVWLGEAVDEITVSRLLAGYQCEVIEEEEMND